MHIDDLDHGTVKILDMSLVPHRLKRLNGSGDVKAQVDSFLMSRLYGLRRMGLIRHSYHRGLIDALLERQKCGDTDVPGELINDVVECKGVSITDSWWVKEDRSLLRWKDVDLRSVPPEDVYDNIIPFRMRAPEGAARHIEDIPALLRGAVMSMAMRWRKGKGGLWFHKHESCGRVQNDGKKSYGREVMVSRILDCFNVQHVAYEQDGWDGKRCRSKNIADKGTDFILACDAAGAHNGYGSFLSYVKRLDKENFAKMCVVDYLITNCDRSGNNWGFLADARTGRICGIAPLFDQGDARFDPSDVPCMSKVLPGRTLKGAAMEMLKDSHIACTRPVKRSMFADDAQYGSFMRRAAALGLYERKRLSWAGRLMARLGLIRDIYAPARAA